ncbi:Crp/Fnr family transcriptional regulator [Mycobacterium riyadhense]|uniref:Transcriptional regulator n=1 Tax=Mycobacterium riyadhense TaxID=486698 RepID=A0A1X2CC04_9MYCO|nr:Crp/Fnr family transcriptional regulator [Mycobacterium riyadhense]MCV7146757.1 Crp/Fnr family transcriptional regulator [Mycobacterium riyadhense]ORW73430.1 transcriptional regulator [Mycobacterium riyadhense]
MSDQSVGPLRHFVQSLTGGESASEAQVRQAAWIARCVGRGASAPLHRDDLAALAGTLQAKEFAPGAVVFHAGHAADGVWIVRQGQIELGLGTGRRRAVVNILHPGDVDGDISLLLEMPMAYTARALTHATCLFLDRQAFERLLATHPAIARRWLSSVAQRVSASQIRLMGLLGRSLPEQVAQLLLDEAVDARVELAQRTLAAMLGAQRPSINKILKEFEHARLITIGYAVIEITDLDGLRVRAQ